MLNAYFNMHGFNYFQPTLVPKTKSKTIRVLKKWIQGNFKIVYVFYRVFAYMNGGQNCGCSHRKYFAGLKTCLL